jgi:hypothetical protein
MVVFTGNKKSLMDLKRGLAYKENYKQDDYHTPAAMNMAVTVNNEKQTMPAIIYRISLISFSISLSIIKDFARGLLTIGFRLTQILNFQNGNQLKALYKQIHKWVKKGFPATRFFFIFTSNAAKV